MNRAATMADLHGMELRIVQEIHASEERILKGIKKDDQLGSKCGYNAVRPSINWFIKEGEHTEIPENKVITIQFF